MGGVRFGNLTPPIWEAAWRVGGKVWKPDTYLAERVRKSIRKKVWKSVKMLEKVRKC